MSDEADRIAALAERHGLSRGAVQALSDAVKRGSGAAQWNHPDLGGMGQWSGGMLQIGDMFNHDLKARVAAVLAELGPSAEKRPSTAGAEHRAEGWWPGDLGSPSSSGAQNAMRYACFPDKRRLVVERDGKVTVYDTGRHRLSGFSQQQSTGQHLAFTGPDGPISLDDLTVVDPA